MFEIRNNENALKLVAPPLANKSLASALLQSKHNSLGVFMLCTVACSYFVHFMLFFFFFFFFFFFGFSRQGLCSPGCPGTQFVDQAGLKLRNPPASASQVLGLKVCATTPSCIIFKILCMMD
jgi:hypothetical protein